MSINGSTRLQQILGQPRQGKDKLDALKVAAHFAAKGETAEIVNIVTPRGALISHQSAHADPRETVTIDSGTYLAVRVNQTEFYDLGSRHDGGQRKNDYLTTRFPGQRVKLTVQSANNFRLLARINALMEPRILAAAEYRLDLHDKGPVYNHLLSGLVVLRLAADPLYPLFDEAPRTLTRSFEYAVDRYAGHVERPSSRAREDLTKRVAEGIHQGRKNKVVLGPMSEQLNCLIPEGHPRSSETTVKGIILDSDTTTVGVMSMRWFLVKEESQLSVVVFNETTKQVAHLFC